MVEAGWYYDPTEETPDGVTCPYCSLSLDSWEPNDDPLEEHRRRAPSCIFFVLTDIYHPVDGAGTQKGRSTSSRSSSVSTKSTTKTAAKSRSAKGKTNRSNRQSEQTNASVDTSELQAEIPAAKPTRRRQRESQLTDSTLDFPEPPKPARKTKRAAQQADSGLNSSINAKPARKNKRQTQETDGGFDSSVIIQSVRKMKQKGEQTDTTLDFVEPPKPVRRTKRQSQGTDNGPLFSHPPKAVEHPKPVQKAKRQSEQTDNGYTFSDLPKPSPARTGRTAKRQSEHTDMSIDPPAARPAKASSATKRKSDQIETDPPESEFRRSKRTRISETQPQLDWPTFSPPESMIACTPPAVFRHETPEAVTPPTPVPRWNPVDLEAFFDSESLPAITELTSPEKRMTIEEFLLHEAKRQEENLRVQMMQQVAKLDVEYGRALAAIDEL